MLSTASKLYLTILELIIMKDSFRQTQLLQVFLFFTQQILHEQ